MINTVLGMGRRWRPWQRQARHKGSC